MGSSNNPMNQQQGQGQLPGSMMGNGQHGMHQGNMGGMPGNGPVSCPPGGIPGNGPGLHHNGMGAGLSGQGQMNDTYSVSQSQTINFTQQTLRQRANGPTGK